MNYFNFVLWCLNAVLWAMNIVVFGRGAFVSTVLSVAVAVLAFFMARSANEARSIRGSNLRRMR